MSDREAFLRAIRAAPADDTPRLVLADWLDDHGDPDWAELIRVQVELEPIHEELDDPRRRELADRETELLARHGDRWLGPVHDIAAEYPAYGPVFRRGLPESVSLSLDTFLARGGELFAACPTVREVCVYGVAGRGAELAACPHLTRVETLEIADLVYDTFPEGSAALAVAIRNAGVRRLRLPALTNPPFCLIHLEHSLDTFVAAGWDVEVEFVQLAPADHLRPEVLAESMNRAAGRDMARAVRPYERQFPLTPDFGHGLHPGRIGGRQVLAAVEAAYPDTSRLMVLIREFDEVGETESERDWHLTPPLAPGQSAESYLRETLGLHPGMIRVREFWSEGGPVFNLWPASYVRDYLTNPFDRPAGVSDRWWDHRGGVLKRWLHEGRFVIEWDGREFWLDSTGTVISS